MQNDLKPYLGLFPELIILSNSEIQGFKGCKRRWYFGDYLGLQRKQKVMVGPLPLGTRVHDSLEAYYTTGENPCDVYNRLLRADNLLFLETMDANDPAKVKKFNNEAELGRIMLEGYLEWLDETNADSDLEVVAAEQKLAKRLIEFDGRIELQGKVDLTVRRRSDDSLAEMDHKTAVGFDPYRKYSHMSEQLMTYTLLQEHATPDEFVDGGIYNLLKKVKRSATATPPFYERIDVRFNRVMLESFWTRTLGVLSDMIRVREELDKGADHRFVAYPKPVMDWQCGTCPFFDLCTMVDDGSQAERYMEDMFEQTDPYERYKDKKEDVNVS